MLNKKEIAKRFRAIRKFLNLTQQKFANKLNISRGYVSELEKGKSIPSPEILLSLEKNFNVNTKWLLIGEGEMFIKPQYQISEILTIKEAKEKYQIETVKADLYQVPQFNEFVPLGPTRELNGKVEDYILLPKSLFPGISAEHIVCIRVHGKSMEPTIKDKALVFVKTNEIEVRKNKIYLIYVEDENGFTIKRVKIKDKFLILYADNPETEDYPKFIDLTKINYNPIKGRVILVLNPI